jgi:hypothetical protein
LLFFSLSNQKNYWLVFFVFWYLWFDYSSFDFFFFYWLFNKSYVPFNLVLQFYFVICYTFQFDPYSFDFFTPPFHISFFLKNIYPSIQVYFILLFSIWPFIFFFFVGVIFIFNLTFHAKLCVIFSFNFLFSSFTPLYRCYFFST